MKTFRFRAVRGQLFLLCLAAVPGGVPARAQSSNTVPLVTVQATQPFASTAHPGIFTVFRAGGAGATLNVWYELGGGTSNGVDYQMIPPHLVTIPAGASSNNIVITPVSNSIIFVRPRAVVLDLTNSPLATPVNYQIGTPSLAVMYLEDPRSPAPVVIGEPNDGAVFSAPTNIPIDAEISYIGYPLPASLEFFAGTNALGPGTYGLSSGFGSTVFLTWTNPPPGAYALTAVVRYDEFLTSTSSPVNLTVLTGPPTNLPPVVNLIAPPNGSMFYTPTNIGMLAKATDPDGSVTNVEFFAGANHLGHGILVVLDPPGSSGVTGPAYLFTWLNPPAGAYPLVAVATDNDGLSTTSAPINITVLPGLPTNRPPVVHLVSPANGAVFRAPIDVPLYAFASDPDGPVIGVEFFGGTNDLGPGRSLPVPVAAGSNATVPIPPIFPTNVFFLVWSNVPAGDYSLTAEATATGGLMATSAPVKIAVLPPLPPPTNRPAIVNLVATDPVAIEGTNCWVWPGETNAAPAWSNWPASVSCLFTNCAPKTATFTVGRFGSTNDDLTVAYSIGGTASNGVDYIALPGFVTVPAGQRRALISIVPIDDGPPDVSQTVILTLQPTTNTPPDYVLGVPRRAAAIILDPVGPRATTVMLPGGCFHLTAPGPDAAWFAIEYSTDMLHWIGVCTNQVVNGSIDFVDPDAQGNAARFYRAVPLAGPPAD